MPSETVLVAAAFEHAHAAEAAVADLGKGGFGQGAVSLMYTDRKHVVEQGVLSGVVYGGVIGGLVGLLFPPAGIVVAAGPILGAVASAISGAATVAVAGGAISGLTSALVQAGMPKEMADWFGEHVHKGDTLIVAHTTPELADQAKQILQSHTPRAASDSTAHAGSDAPAATQGTAS